MVCSPEKPETVKDKLVSDRIPIVNPVGAPGWLTVEGRTLRAEFPDMPKTNKEFSLDGIDLDRLAGMLLDQRDMENAEDRRRNKNSTSTGESGE